MKHFTVWQGVHFARGVASSTDRLAMEAHLASGCARCRRLVTTMQRMTVVGRNEGESEPPVSAMRYATPLFPRHRQEPAGVARVMPRLIKDTSLAPLPAGLRAEANATRYLLYEAGP